jgi:hypothetical protein
MSTDYIPDRQFDFKALRGFRRGVVRVYESERRWITLTDGKNYLTAYSPAGRYPLVFQRSSSNNVSRIIRAIERAFSVELVCEYDARYESLLNRSRKPTQPTPFARSKAADRGRQAAEMGAKVNSAKGRRVS